MTQQYGGYATPEAQREAAEMNKQIRNDRLRKVMVMAHSIRKATGCDMSTALTRAWAMVKIEELETRVRAITYGRMTNADYDMADQCNAEIKALKSRIAA